MPKNNNQAKKLVDEFKAINQRMKAYLDEVDKKMAEMDLKYAKLLVQHDINMMKAAKGILENK